MTPTQIHDTLRALLAPHGFTLHSFDKPDRESMGGWHMDFRSADLTVAASQDRSGDGISICVGSLTRRAPQKHMRGPWSLSHLHGFLHNSRVHHRFESIADEIDWFRDALHQLLDRNLLNSDELNDWAVSATRFLFSGSKVQSRDGG